METVCSWEELIVDYISWMKVKNSYQGIGKVHVVYAELQTEDWTEDRGLHPAQVTVGNKKGDSSAAIVRVISC